MNQRVLIALLTALGFAAGFGARVLTEAEKVVPPPAIPGAEFVRNSTVPAAPTESKADKHPGISEKDRAKLLADIEKVRPQIDAYHKRMDEIAADFDRDFVSVLTAEQRSVFDAQQKRSAENRAKRAAREAAETGPLSDQQIEQFKRQPLWNALWAISVNGRLEHLVRDYKLTPEQRTHVRSLLLARREKFLALVDSTPAPSITYSELASRAQKLVAEPSK